MPSAQGGREGQAGLRQCPSVWPHDPPFMPVTLRPCSRDTQAFGFQSAPHQWISRSDSADKVIVCERGDLVFVFNFHPTKSYTDYRVGCNASGPYKVGGG